MINLTGSYLAKASQSILNIIRREHPILKNRPTIIVGPTIGADGLVASVIYTAHRLKSQPQTGMIIREQRKKHGYKQIIENLQPTPADVILIDDYKRTGTTLQYCRDVLYDHDYNIVTEIILEDIQK